MSWLARARRGVRRYGATRFCAMRLRRLAFPLGTRRDAFWATYLRPAMLRSIGRKPLPPAQIAGTRVSGHAVPEPPIRSILLIKSDHVGDFLLALPAFALFRRSFPEAVITLLCGSWNVDNARHSGLFDTVLTLPTPLPPFDLAIDLRVDEDSRALLGRVTARHKAGFASVLMPDGMTLVLPPPRTSGTDTRPHGQHERAMMMQLAGAVVARFDPLGESVAALQRIVAAGTDVQSLLPAEMRRPLIVVSPFSGRAIKNWPAQHYKTIVTWLATDRLATVFLVGSSDQCRDAAALERQIASRSVHNIVGRTRLDQVFALIGRADLFLGNDSGLAHAAALLRRPTVALYAGIAPIARWQPIGPHVTTLHTEVSCAPCGLRHRTDCAHDHVCMTAISVEAVQAAVEAALRTTQY